MDRRRGARRIRSRRTSGWPARGQHAQDTRVRGADGRDGARPTTPPSATTRARRWTSTTSCAAVRSDGSGVSCRGSASATSSRPSEREHAQQAVDTLAATVAPKSDAKVSTVVKWATRAGCHIDRAASAWLIRRFLDDHAEFSFVERSRRGPRRRHPVRHAWRRALAPRRRLQLRDHLAPLRAHRPRCSGMSPVSCTKPTSPTNASTRPKDPASTCSAGACRWSATTTRSSRSPARSSTVCTNTAAVRC